MSSELDNPQQSAEQQAAQTQVAQQPETAQQPTQAQAQAESSEEFASFRDALKERGFDEQAFENLGDEEILDLLVHNYRQAGQLEQLARYGQWAVENWDKIKHLVGDGQTQQPTQAAAQAQAAPAAQQAAEEEKPYWEPGPEWDPRLEQFLDYDADGNLIVKGINDPTLPTRYLERKRWERDALMRLLSGPYEVIEPKLKKAISAAVEEAVEKSKQWFNEQFSKEKDERFVNAFLQANEQALYRCDGNGRPITDPRTGQPILTDAGKKFFDKVAELQNAGIKDTVLATHYALQMVPLGNNQEKADTNAQSASAQPPEVAARERFLSAEHRPPRTGSFLTGSREPPQNTLDLSPEERMRQWIAKYGEPAGPNA